MDTIISYGIIYLLIFRLAVLLLGGLCIFWGYRLFLSLRQQAGSSPDTADQGSELHGRIGSSELAIKSTAPGIFFAAFGAVIVIAVLAGKQPDVSYDERQSKPQTVALRSASVRSLPPAHVTRQDAGTADYNRVVRDVPEAIDRLRTAVSMAPDNPDYRDLLARLLFAWGESDKAAAEQQRAVELVEEARREEFQARLDMYQ